MNHTIESTVAVHLPAPTWWKLASLADQRGIRIVDLLIEVAMTGAASRPEEVGVTLTTQQAVAVRLANGVPVPLIAEELGLTTQTVYYHRRNIRRSPR